MEKDGLMERMTRLSDMAGNFAGRGEVVSSEDRAAVVKFWEMLEDKNFLKMLLDYDSFARERVEIILSAENWRLDKPGMRIPEKVVLRVINTPKGLEFFVIAYIEIDTRSERFKTAFGVATETTEVEEGERAINLATLAYGSGYSYDGVVVSNYRTMMKLHRLLDADDVTKSYPRCVGEWLETVENYLHAFVGAEFDGVSGVRDCP